MMDFNESPIAIDRPPHPFGGEWGTSVASHEEQTPISAHRAEQERSEDIFAAMLHTEEHYLPSTPFRSHHRHCDELPIKYPEWRSKICDWSYRIVDHFSLDREVVGIAMNLFDRYSAICKAEAEVEAESSSRLRCPFPHAITTSGRKHDLPRSPRSVVTVLGGYEDQAAFEKDESRIYQLAAMTCLYLSIKLHSENVSDGSSHAHTGGAAKGRRTRHRLALMSFVELSRGQFSAADMTQMEQTLLKALKWRVNPPTPTAFVNYILDLVPSVLSDKISPHQQDLVMHYLHELSRYMTELSVCVPHMSTIYRPSFIAYASILVCMNTVREEAMQESVREEFRSSVARISARSGGCGVLTPDCPTIQHIMRSMRSRFLPNMLKDISGPSGPRLQGQEDFNSHPIAIAQDANLLNLDSLSYLIDGLGDVVLTPCPSDEDPTRSEHAPNQQYHQHQHHQTVEYPFGWEAATAAASAPCDVDWYSQWPEKRSFMTSRNSITSCHSV